MVSETGAQMSETMTSAPSRASRTACARPCPRAAPVTNATRPSRVPVAPAISVLSISPRQASKLTETCSDGPALATVAHDDDPKILCGIYAAIAAIALVGTWTRMRPTWVTQPGS